MMNLTEIRLVCDIIKSRFGVYVDNPKNRALHRVGNPYGHKNTGDGDDEGNDAIENGKINFKKLNRLTNEILNGRKRIDSLNKEEERASKVGNRRNVEASLICKGIRRFYKENSGITGNGSEVKKYESALKEYAKKRGCWYSISDVIKNTSKKLASGAEASVYVGKDNKSVVKVIYPYGMSMNMDEFLDNRISLYNYLFPETAYKVLGFGADSEGKFFVVVRQPLIKGSALATELIGVDDVKESMQKLKREIYLDINERIGNLNSEYSGRGNQYVNDEYVIEDVHLDNVIRTPKGNLAYIDVVPSLNTEEDYTFGKRKYGDGNVIDNG